MPLCAQRTCGCAITSTDLSVAGSGTAVDPWIISYPVSGSLLPMRTFVDAATRDAALPSPIEGQEVWLSTPDTKHRYVGGAWRTIFQGATSYTPTFTNFTPGASTIVGRYTRSDDEVSLWGSVIFGAGASFSGGSVAMSVPITGISISRMTGGMGWYDASAGNTYAGACNISAPGTSLQMYVMVGGQFFPTNAYPFAWANPDEFWWNITYVAL